MSTEDYLPPPSQTMVFAPASQAPIGAPSAITKRRGHGRWLLLVLCCVLIIPILCGAAYAQAVYSPAQSSGATVPVAIASGQTVDQISQLLKNKHLISHPLFFKAYMRLSGGGSHIQAGDYQVPEHVSIKALAGYLSIATREHVTLRFLEGWRREEMGEYIDQQRQSTDLPQVTGADFAQLALSPTQAMRQKLGSRLPSDASLQGFLFPDTYQIDKDSTAESLIETMLSTYQSKVTPAMQAGWKAQGLTEYQGVILASIVEREGRTDQERPVIAGILLKRLKIGEPLGVDATLQYALGYSEKEKRWWRQNLSDVDLALESPYNMRKVAGLPPRPICNPGLSAMTAVSQPQTSNYLFYLHDSQGQIHYATTLAQHNANVARYLR